MTTTETQFTDDQIGALGLVVDMIIPASAEYALPGANDPVIFADILATADTRHGPVQGALSALDALAREHHGDGFTALEAVARDGVVEAFRRLHPGEAEILAVLAAQCYYRDARVMGSLEMQARPPFPEGFDVDQGDWSLLDPIKERPEFYRKTP